MKVTVRESAEEDLHRIFSWIAEDNPRLFQPVIAPFSRLQFAIF